MNIIKYICFFILISTCCDVLAIKKGRFLLISGPSGVGKSTVISYLKQLDSNFIYVTPYTTRKLRPGEQDKVSISIEQMHDLDRASKLLTINKIYGIYYGTPRDIIDTALINGKNPILDWPIEKIEIMQKQYKDKLFVVYLHPEDINELKARLSIDKRDVDGKRIDLGVQELKNFYNGEYDNSIDLKIVNKNELAKQIASLIYKKFMQL